MPMADRERVLTGFIRPKLVEHGLIVRVEERIAPLIQISPPLVAGQAEFDEMTRILGEVLAEAQPLLGL